MKCIILLADAFKKRLYKLSDNNIHKTLWRQKNNNRLVRAINLRAIILIGTQSIYKYLCQYRSYAKNYEIIVVWRTAK